MHTKAFAPRARGSNTRRRGSELGERSSKPGERIPTIDTANAAPFQS